MLRRIDLIKFVDFSQYIKKQTFSKQQRLPKISKDIFKLIKLTDFDIY